MQVIRLQQAETHQFLVFLFGSALKNELLSTGNLLFTGRHSSFCLKPNETFQIFNCFVTAHIKLLTVISQTLCNGRSSWKPSLVHSFQVWQWTMSWLVGSACLVEWLHPFTAGSEMLILPHSRVNGIWKVMTPYWFMSCFDRLNSESKS